MKNIKRVLLLICFLVAGNDSLKIDFKSNLLNADDEVNSGNGNFDGKSDTNRQLSEQAANKVDFNVNATNSFTYANDTESFGKELPQIEIANKFSSENSENIQADVNVSVIAELNVTPAYETFESSVENSKHHVNAEKHPLKNIAANVRKIESALTGPEIHSGDSADQSVTFFKTVTGLSPDSASLGIDYDDGENNQSFVASSTSAPATGDEGNTSEQSLEGGVPLLPTETPLIKLAMSENNFDREFSNNESSQVQQTFWINDYTNISSSDRQASGASEKTTKHENYLQESKSSLDAANGDRESRIGGLHLGAESEVYASSVATEAIPIVETTSSEYELEYLVGTRVSERVSTDRFDETELNTRKPTLETQVDGSIDIQEELADNVHVDRGDTRAPSLAMEVINSNPIRSKPIEGRSLAFHKKDDERSLKPNVEGSTLPSIEDTTVFMVQKISGKSPFKHSSEQMLQTSNIVSNSSQVLPLNETKTSNINATEIFFQLLRENQLLKTLVYHLHAKVSRNELEAKLNSSVPQDALFGLSDKAHSEQDFNAQIRQRNESFETTTYKSKHLTNLHETSTESLKSYSKSLPDLDSQKEGGLLSDMENSTVESTSEAPQTEDEYEDFVDGGDSLYNSTSIYNATVVIPKHVVYSDPEPLPYDGDEISFQLNENHVPAIRKCCSATQFFSLESQSCLDTSEETQFEYYTRELMLGNQSVSIELIYGRQSACPLTGKPPKIQVGISNYTHLLDMGSLYDVSLATHFDEESYCLEMVGQDVPTAVLTAAFCIEEEHDTPTSMVRKCCPLDHYFDASQRVCIPNEENMPGVQDLVREFSGSFTDSTSVVTAILTCKSGISDLLSSSEAYLNSVDQLCIKSSGPCYPSSLYCIEYVQEQDGFHTQPMAAYCPLSSFKKCCPPHQILENNMCKDSDDPLSPYLTQLMATLHTQTGFPFDTSDVCVHLLLNSLNVRWWVTNSGYLSIDSGRNQMLTRNYCIDDSVENEQVITIAHVCTEELKQSVSLPLSVFDRGTVGKCCPFESHLSPIERDCSPGKSVHILDEDPLLAVVNITKLGYTGFPHCESGQYHLYNFDPNSGDHVVFKSDSQLYVVSMDGRCVEKETALDNVEFCLDYGWDAEEPELASAVVCAPPETSNKYHSEKYNLTSALLAVSCCSLLIALVSLVCMRVRRGLVTVKKMNTLAGRILISYVSANFAGFLALAISMHVEAKEGASVCMALSGIVQFFLLAAFFWNTSICSESLFLTLRVRVSEGRRLLYHSLWAWGLPAVITIVALTLDSVRDRLPCGTITLRVGHVKCIFSDSDATLIYFYGPIAMTLVANTVLLLSAKQARFAKLQRLEMGPSKPPSNKGSVVTSPEGKSMKSTISKAPSAGHSGLRTHQNRNLWSESVRLVLWSGLTWVLEVIGFIVPRYISLQQERWHDYLWYLPASINSLRGFGIFFILVMTTEMRSKILRAIGTFKGTSSSIWKSERSQPPRNNNSYQASGDGISMTTQSSKYPVRNVNKQRNMSVATTVTNITHLHPSPHDSEETTVRPRLVHSISQMERRESTTSSNFSAGDEEVENEDISRRRRSSAAPISLPSVDEEDDDFIETSLSTVALPKDSPTDSVFGRDSEA
ncbi:uncharacterized protein LOC108667210 [Hyalella azteca]|uniref:Uncharacterized protein LOC108667210 n=1 Tax=Hyalella azteca TaxID=294128 RepID=A0A8B7N8T1_HYAAZ|nr:uncharacterized protein LOC108667210 [Hyalella azteca]